MSNLAPTDLATLPVWAADELRRQAEEIAALRAALEGAERRQTATYHFVECLRMAVQAETLDQWIDVRDYAQVLLAPVDGARED